jgi:hypothetical protein
MNKKDLDALAGLYESVYSPPEGEYLVEDIKSFSDRGGAFGSLRRAISRSGTDAGKAQNRAAVSSAVSRANQGIASFMNRGGVFGRGGAVDRLTNRQTPAAKPAAKPQIGSLPSSARQVTQYPAGVPTGVGGGNAGASTTKPAARPAARPAGTAPAARPATPGSGAKVAPSSAAKPATPAPGTKAAGPGSIKPKTPNPLLKDNELSKMRAASIMRQNNMSLPGAKNPTSSDIGMSQQKAKAAEIVKSGKVAALAPKPTPSTGKPGSVTSSFEWTSAKTIKELANAYASIYEAKKKDQDEDGDTDFADVRIARMIASGMSKAEAIAAVRNKEYNEEFESWLDSLVEEGYDLSDYTMEEMFDSYLEEATRMRKELGKEGEIATRKELAARSKAYKRSGSVDRTIAAAERAADWSEDEKKAKTLRGLAASRKGSVRDKPRAGLRGYAAKVEGDDKDLQSARGSARSAGTLTPREKKQLGEVYEIVSSYLLENNFAGNINDANVIIENMSEVWLNEILSQEN